MADYAVSRNTVNTVKDSRQHIRKGKGLYDLDARVLHTATASAAAISSRGESGVGFDLLLCGTGVAYLRTAVDGRIHAKYDTGEIGPIKMGSGDASCWPSAISAETTPRTSTPAMTPGP